MEDAGAHLVFGLDRGFLASPHSDRKEWGWAMSFRTLCRAVCLATMCMLGFHAASAAPSPTTTTLTMTSGGATLTSGGAFPSGSVLTLTAAVNLGATPLTNGQVTFCDASAAHCTDIHLLGVAQLTSAGIATVRLRPGVGSHSYKAIFLGTPHGSVVAAASSSSVASLNVTGTHPSTTTLAVSGEPGSYTLTATVNGILDAPGPTAPTGVVSFLDTSNNNAVLASAPVSSGTRGLSFVNSSNPVTVSEPNAVAAADFNGDGITDLAVSNSNSGQVILTILLGNGDGTFKATAASPTVGLYPDAIIVGDYNGDGVPDLAVTSVDDNRVTVLLGKGDGTFIPAPTLDTISTPQSMATGDFNGDGIADLAVTNANSVLVYLGNGDGSFHAPVAVPLPGLVPSGIAVGDFNGDGAADLAVTNSANPGTVAILLGKGDGTFTQNPISPAGGSYTSGIAVGDFNKDGVLDLAVTDSGGGSGSIAVTILTGHGDGTFTAASYAAPGVDFRSVVIADFNGVGVADLAIGGFWQSTLVTLMGNGDGTFSEGTSVGADAPLSSGHVASADFNGDGIPDLVTPNGDPNGTAVVLLAQPAQTVTASVSPFALNGIGTHQVSAHYSGDSAYSPSASSTSGLVALLTPTMTVMPSAANIPNAQQALAVTIKVNGGKGNPTPTGYVSLEGGSYTAGYAMLVNGSTTITIPAGALSNGANTLTSIYTPDYQSSTVYLSISATGSVTVGAPPAAAAPVFSPGAGAYAAAQSITITDTTPAAAIFYTTDGTTPTTSSVVYSQPIAVSSSATIEAMAVASGYASSPVATAAYTITLPNPVPTVTSLSPAFTNMGGPALILTVNGTGFAAGSQILWRGSPLATNYLSTTQLSAQLPASDIAIAGVTAVTVETPSPGGGTSQPVEFEVDSTPSGTPPPAFAAATATVAPGSTASYAVTLPASVTTATAACLNLPAGATCSYSVAAKALTIATASTSPAGSYQVTVVFTETEPLNPAAFGFLPFLWLPTLFAAPGKKPSRTLWQTAVIVLILLGAAGSMTACGGNSSPSTGGTASHQTQQVTSSAIVGLTIQ